MVNTITVVYTPKQVGMGVVGSVMGGWSVMPAIVQQLLRTEVLRWPAGQSSGSMRSCARDAESVCLLVRKVHWRSSTGRCEWFPKSYVTDSAPAWENVLEERPAPEFDEGAVEKRLEELRLESGARTEGAKTAEALVSLGCPGSAVRDLRTGETASTETAGTGESRGLDERGGESLLEHWPVQLGLANPMAPVYRGANLLITADCVPVAYRRFQEEFLEGRRVVMFCPKLDDAPAHLERLTELLATTKPASVMMVHMEVPCCYGLKEIVFRAAEAAGLDVSIEEVVIGVNGGVLSTVKGS